MWGGEGAGARAQGPLEAVRPLTRHLVRPLPCGGPQTTSVDHQSAKHQPPAVNRQLPSVEPSPAPPVAPSTTAPGL